MAVSTLILWSDMKTIDAIKYYGSRRKLADAMGIKDVSSISHWGTTVPERRQFQLQVLTDGSLVAQKQTEKDAA